MTGGLLSALLFGVTSVVARRAIRLVGMVRANALRLAVAVGTVEGASLAETVGALRAAGLLVLAGAIIRWARAGGTARRRRAARP